jgi:hypothetical protein
LSSPFDPNDDAGSAWAGHHTSWVIFGLPPGRARQAVDRALGHGKRAAVDGASAKPGPDATQRGR